MLVVTLRGGILSSSPLSLPGLPCTTDERLSSNGRRVVMPGFRLVVGRPRRSRVEAVIGVEGGLGCRRGQRVVVRVFRHREHFCPIRLFVIAACADVVLNDLVYSFGLSVSLRMECGGYPLSDAEQFC